MTWITDTGQQHLASWPQSPITKTGHGLRRGLRQNLQQGVAGVGRVGGRVFNFVFAHAQGAALARNMFEAFDVAPKRRPFLGRLSRHQLAHLQALHLDRAGAMAAFGGHLQGDGTAHPGAHATGQFFVPLVACRGFAAVCIHIAASAWCGLGGAFAIAQPGGLGGVQHAAVGKCLGACLLGHLAANRRVFARANLGHGGGAGHAAKHPKKWRGERLKRGHRG